MKKRAFIVLCCAFAAVILSGCAAMKCGNQTTVSIKTDVPAKVKIVNVYNKIVRSGKTPLTVSLHTMVNNTLIQHSKDPASYKIIVQEIENPKNIQDFIITANINPWIAGNIALLVPLGFPIGLAVDYRSGAAYRFEKEYFFQITE